MSKKSDLLLRYENKLRGDSAEWFDSDEYEDIALEYEMAMMPDKALQAIETGLKYYPMSENLLIRKAYYYMLTGEIEEAKDTISIVTDIGEESQLVRAELMLIENEVSKAIKIIADILEKDNLRSETILSIIDLCADYKLYDDLCHKLFNTIQKLQRSQRLTLLREFLSILEEESEIKWQAEVVELILDLDPYSISDWIKCIEIHIYQSEIEQARKAIEYALAIEPSNAEAHYYKAYCHMYEGDYEGAIPIIEKLDKTTDENLYVMLATCHTKMGKYDESDRILKECEEHYPVNSRTLYVSAQNAYRGQRDIERAVELLKRAEQLDSYSSDIPYMLATLYYEQEKYNEAEEALVRLKDTDYEATDSRAYILKGDIEIKSGRPAEALKNYQKVMMLDKYDIDTCFKMIYTYSELHDVENMEATIHYVENLISQENVEATSEEEQFRIQNLRVAVEKIKRILRSHIDENI